MMPRYFTVAAYMLCSIQAAQLSIDIEHRWGKEAIALSESWHPAAKASTLSLSRIAYLISEPVFIDERNQRHPLFNWYALIDVGAGKTRLNFPDIPSLQYKMIEFSIGLIPEINQSNPAKFAPDHPLNPIRNKLHWNWQDGYIFLALEGHWQSTGKEGGYSYHLGNEPNRMQIRLPLSVDLSEKNAHLLVDFHLDRVLQDLPFAAASTTHGRPGDPLALSLKKRVENAFSSRSVASYALGQHPKLPIQEKPSFIGTAYPLEISENFPLPSLPLDFPLTHERVELGRRLFHDAALSRNDSLSCVTCHQTEHAFADNRSFSRGIDQQLGRRNTMPLMNLAWKDRFFWDGRVKSLREQALISIENKTEMDASLPEIELKLSRHPAYPSLFKAAYGTREITAERIGVAIEAFLLTQTSFESRFDRAIKGELELTELEKRGLELFFTEYDPRRKQYGADCFHCHGGPLFSDQAFHNNGLAMKDDLGLSEFTRRDSDVGKFSTPSLRNLIHTAPYMHDGRLATLEAVMEHYRRGIQRNPTLDPNLAKHPAPGIPISDKDSAALIAFLKTLSD